MSLWCFLNTVVHVTHDLKFFLDLPQDLIVMIVAWALCVTSGGVVS